MVKIAVLITCHNRKDNTLSCFKTLLKSVECYNSGCVEDDKVVFSTFLTDDGCTDGTAEAVGQLLDNYEYNIIKGNGDLYWNGGMRAAWNEALKRHAEWDFYLLLNDDTDIMDNAFEVLFETHEFCIRSYGRDGIYSGITCYKSDESKMSYGGDVMVNKFLSKHRRLEPNGCPQMVDLTNANILMVSMDVVDEIGIFWHGYRHANADGDYSLKARRHEIPVLLTPCFIGRCNYDHVRGDDEGKMVMSMSMSERRRYFNKPTNSTRDYLKYVLRNEPIRFPMVLVGRIMNIYFPKLYYPLKNKVNDD